MSIVIVLNNYFHDVATATLLSSAVIVYILGRRAEQGTLEERLFFARAYRSLTKLAWFALAWIIIGGIPRTLFFPTYEFIPAQQKGLIFDLAIKHVVMFSAVGIGAFVWIRTGKIARAALAEAGDQR
jgi:hypothetical protein